MSPNSALKEKYLSTPDGKKVDHACCRREMPVLLTSKQLKTPKQAAAAIDKPISD